MMRNRFFTLPLLILLIIPSTMASAQTGATNKYSTTGCGSPIVVDSKNVQLTIVCGPKSAELDSIVKKMNALAAQNKLTLAELESFVRAFNTKIDKLGSDVDEIKLEVAALKSRVDLAAESPERAKTILRPYLDPPIDITNRAYDINEFLDANGKSEYKLTFEIKGNCQIYITPPQYTGFKVAIGILSTSRSVIWSSLLGTQPRYRPIPLATGVYLFIMKATRDAGQYTATISSQCTS